MSNAHAQVAEEVVLDDEDIAALAEFLDLLAMFDAEDKKSDADAAASTVEGAATPGANQEQSE